jgi:hypothetical protein
MNSIPERKKETKPKQWSIITTILLQKNEETQRKCKNVLLAAGEKWNAL